MPTIPPAVPTYAGPSVLLRATAVSVSLVSNPNYPWVNQNNLVGPPDGKMATSTVPLTSNALGDKLLLSVRPPSQFLPCYILGYSYELRTISSTALAAKVGIFVQIATAAGVVKGGGEQVHEFNPTPGDWGMAEYAGNEAVGFADRITFFQLSGTSVGVANCATLADLGGMVLQLGSDVNDGGNATVTMDTADLTVYYVPRARGTSISLAISAVSAVSAATAGIALDPLWGPETAWNNISRALTIGTPNSTSSADATQSDTTLGGAVTDQASQTQFVKFDVAAGALAAMISRMPVDLELIWRGRYAGGEDPAGGGTAQDWTIIGEIAIVQADATILLKAVSSGKVLYDGQHFKVNTQGTQVPASERDRPFVVDVSGLTSAQIANMNANGFSIYMRWNICTPVNSGGNPGSVFLNGIAANMSYRAASPNGVGYVGTLPPGVSVGVGSSLAYRNRWRRMP